MSPVKTFVIDHALLVIDVLLVYAMRNSASKPVISRQRDTDIVVSVLLYVIQSVRSGHLFPLVLNMIEYCMLQNSNL